VDLGPEGGSGGGRIVAEGTPEEIADVPESHTGKFLTAVLSRTDDPPIRPKRRRVKAARAEATAR
jgi:excinuclease ABC subunit A